jgi:Dolichyl-phosphate-mannose-protein mannosyltransferase
MLDKVGFAPPLTARADRRGEWSKLCVPYVKALAIYLCSRLLVFLGVVFGQIYITLGNDTWLGGHQWYHRLLRWDSEWYKIIATEGYKYDGDPGLTQTVVFYPLYPALSRLVSEITGIEIIDSMLLVANLATVVAILLLFKLVREHFDDRTALATVAMVSFFPSSIFLSAGYTEPLALLLMVVFFLAITRQRFCAAAMLAGLAVATRSSGIVLFPVLLWELWRCRSPGRFLAEAIPLSIVATSGLWLYVIYLGFAFGHPMAFADGQAAFHESTTMPTRLASALLLEPFGRIHLTDISPAGLDQWFTLIFIALIVRSWFTPVSRGMTLFAVMVLALPYLTLCGGPAGFTSMARFNIVSFPLFIVMALLTERWRWAFPGIVGISGGLLMMYSALFAQWQWVG